MYITKEEWEHIQSSPETGLALINKALDRVRNSVMEECIKRLPAAVIVMQHHYKMREAVAKDFYDRNPTFRDNKDIVKDVVLKIESENPAKKYDEILKLSEPLIMERIRGLSQPNINLKEPIANNLTGNGEL